MALIDLWLVTHDWGDDNSTWVCPSREKAIESMYQYVSDNWEGIPHEMPQDQEEAVDSYFDFFDTSEWYRIEKCSLNVDLPSVEVPFDEAVLTSQQLRILDHMLTNPTAPLLASLKRDLGFDSIGSILNALKEIRDELRD